MPRYQKYSWIQFDRDAKRIAKIVRQKHLKFDGVWGPARGGLPLAVTLSHALGIPLLQKVENRRTLIVDDIADTGKTLKKYSRTHFIATLFYHSQSAFEPAIWIRKKGDTWILFPWEKNG